jgi:hypothetical protein
VRTAPIDKKIQMPIIATDSQDPMNLPMAKEIAEILNSAYPGHSWYVRIDGGILNIRALNFSGKVGMVRHFSDIAHDAKARKDDVTRAAGELLERANLRRGQRDDTQVRVLEGAEKFKWQPPRIIH